MVLTRPEKQDTVALSLSQTHTCTALSTKQPNFDDLLTADAFQKSDLAALQTVSCRLYAIGWPSLIN